MQKVRCVVNNAFSENELSESLSCECEVDDPVCHLCIMWKYKFVTQVLVEWFLIPVLLSKISMQGCLMNGKALVWNILDVAKNLSTISNIARTIFLSIDVDVWPI